MELCRTVRCSRGGIVRQTAILVDKIGQKNRSTVQVQIDEHLRDKIVLSGEDRDLELATYGGQDFGDGSSQEPNDTLVNGEYRISGEHHGHQ